VTLFWGTLVLARGLWTSRSGGWQGAAAKRRLHSSHTQKQVEDVNEKEMHCWRGFAA
jgi:hypothetical protein